MHEGLRSDLGTTSESMLTSPDKKILKNFVRREKFVERRARVRVSIRILISHDELMMFIRSERKDAIDAISTLRSRRSSGVVGQEVTARVALLN